jgi:hypothetical protein
MSPPPSTAPACAACRAADPRALKYLEKNIPDLQKMAMAFMPLGTADELRAQIIEVALDRAFLNEPLPIDAASFKARWKKAAAADLIANEVARLAGGILTEYAAAVRKLKDTRPPRTSPMTSRQQLQRLCPSVSSRRRRARLQHLPRYLKAIALRLDKLRADPARDAQRLAELRPLEQRYAWLEAGRAAGARDARIDEFRWLLEELRVSLFAQELKHAAAGERQATRQNWFWRHGSGFLCKRPQRFAVFPADVPIARLSADLKALCGKAACQVRRGLHAQGKAKAFVTGLVRQKSVRDELVRWPIRLPGAAAVDAQGGQQGAAHAGQQGAQAVEPCCGDQVQEGGRDEPVACIQVDVFERAGQVEKLSAHLPAGGAGVD